MHILILLPDASRFGQANREAEAPSSLQQSQQKRGQDKRSRR
jgi:hypothetical protein